MRKKGGFQTGKAARLNVASCYQLAASAPVARIRTPLDRRNRFKRISVRKTLFLMGFVDDKPPFNDQADPAYNQRRQKQDMQ